MSVGFKTKELIEEIGGSDLLNAFFSTINYRLENQDWGSKYPKLMNDLFNGNLKHSDSKIVLSNVLDAREKLKKFKPKDVVWDIYDLKKQPPWGDDISSDITNLSEYFVTNSGEDVFDVLIRVLQHSIEKKEDVSIIQV